MRNTALETKGVEYYLALKYPVTLRELSEDEGGGFLATIPILGEKTFLADGATPAEALEALDELRQELIPNLVSRGVAISEPNAQADEAESYSGSLMLRVSRQLHGRLVAAAKRNGISLNKFAAELLASGLGERSAIEDIRNQVQDALAEMRSQASAPENRAAISSAFPNAKWNLSIDPGDEDDNQDAIRRYQQGKAA